MKFFTLLFLSGFLFISAANAQTTKTSKTVTKDGVTKKKVVRQNADGSTSVKVGRKDENGNKEAAGKKKEADGDVKTRHAVNKEDGTKKRAGQNKNADGTGTRKAGVKNSDGTVRHSGTQKKKANGTIHNHGEAGKFKGSKAHQNSKERHNKAKSASKKAG